jgi:hypothetical protein
MRARIFWRIDDFEDSKVIEADTLDELRAEAESLIAHVGATDYWSEDVE